MFIVNVNYLYFTISFISFFKVELDNSFLVSKVMKFENFFLLNRTMFLFTLVFY